MRRKTIAIFLPYKDRAPYGFCPWCGHERINIVIYNFISFYNIYLCFIYISINFKFFNVVNYHFPVLSSIYHLHLHFFYISISLKRVYDKKFSFLCFVTNPKTRRTCFYLPYCLYWLRKCYVKFLCRSLICLILLCYMVIMFVFIPYI